MFYYFKHNMLLCYILVVFMRLIVSVSLLHKQAESRTIECTEIPPGLNVNTLLFFKTGCSEY